jgi:hypothetical protein
MHNWRLLYPEAPGASIQATKRPRRAFLDPSLDAPDLQMGDTEGSDGELFSSSSSSEP